MALGQYHIGKGNIPRQCKATKNPCKLEHFDNLEVAEKHIKDTIGNVTKITKSSQTFLNEFQNNISENSYKSIQELQAITGASLKKIRNDEDFSFRNGSSNIDFLDEDFSSEINFRSISLFRK